MLVLRCTRKLLTRVAPPVDDPPLSTTALGDWYTQPFGIGHQRFVLLISEHSRLPVLMPGRDAKNLPRNFAGALAEMLEAVGVPPVAIEGEVGEMQGGRRREDEQPLPPRHPQRLRRDALVHHAGQAGRQHPRARSAAG